MHFKIKRLKLLNALSKATRAVSVRSPLPVLTGIKFEYLPKTEIIVQKHISTSVDKVKVVKTGRVAYAKINSYKVIKH